MSVRQNMDSILQGYAFKNPALLEDALTHTSLEQPGSTPPVGYERLEFLGDRVLGLVIAALLVERYPDEAEGALARRHAALVQRPALADVARRLNLGDHIRLSEGEASAGGAEKDTILADTLEALIGALYLDGGIAPVETFIHLHWEPLLDSHAEPPKDPKTALQEWAQARGKSLPAYKVVKRSGPDHAPDFTVRVTVEGAGAAEATASSKREAEKLAAEELFKVVMDHG